MGGKISKIIRRLIRRLILMSQKKGEFIHNGIMFFEEAKNA
ncbi:hypothetical protein [Halarsenatibacter silvermanii]|nr:hypothetical protein [Halarsenatibacter silvermanii]